MNNKYKGKTLQELEQKEISKVFELPENLKVFLKDNAVIGVNYILDEEIDLSGLGVDMIWMNSKQMISEVTEVHPGIEAIQSGYIPIGVCLEGTGDNYYYNQLDGSIVRIPHDAVKNDILLKDRVEKISNDIKTFIDNAEIAEN